MKAENYLLQHILDHNISLVKIEDDIGVNLNGVVSKGKELSADEFMTLCVYLGISADEVKNKVL